MNNDRTLRSAFLHSVSMSGRLTFAIGLAVLLASTLAFASHNPQGTFERTLQVTGPVDLEVLTHSGDITIRAGSSGSVFIRGKIYVSHWNILPGVEIGGHKEGVQDVEQNPPIRQDGNSIHIDYVNGRDIAVDYEITVPVDTSIRARSGSGDQVIEGTHGNVDLQAGSGSLKLTNLTGEVRMQTGSGDVRARGIAGAVRGGTGSGDIEIEETGAGDLDLHTGSGTINARGVQGGFHGETGSGDVTVEGTQSGTWEVHTGSGNVHVRLPGNAAFEADISTSSGTVDIDAPVEMTVQGRVQEMHRSIHGNVRGGAAAADSDRIGRHTYRVGIW